MQWSRMTPPPSLKPDDQVTLLSLLGATIRQYRQQRGLVQAALATTTSLSHTYITEIEQGHRNLSVLSLVRIADALRALADEVDRVQAAVT